MWEPLVFRVARHEVGVVIACDGSYEPESGHGAYAVVSSAGGICAASVLASSSIDVEREALLAGLEFGIASEAVSVSLVSDSLAAIDLLEEMLSLSHSGHKFPDAERLRSIRRRLPADVVVHHVRARDGSALHSAADMAAFAVRRASTKPQELSAASLERVIDEIPPAPEGTPEQHIPVRALKRLIVTALGAPPKGTTGGSTLS